jgi:hypothetical protein
MNAVYEKLKKIKNEKKEKRLGKLQEICSDDNIDEAIEIAKHQSGINLPGASFITAMTAVLFTFIKDDLTRAGLFILWIISIWYIITVGFEKWTEVYYDLMELKRIRRGPSVD